MTWGSNIHCEDCEGAGWICTRCREGEAACDCDRDGPVEFERCEECDGTGVADLAYFPAEWMYTDPAPLEYVI